jgi:hypothetical protein
VSSAKAVEENMLPIKKAKGVNKYVFGVLLKSAIL